jgi:hypothetical protein
MQIQPPMLLTPSQTLDLYDCIWPIILHNQQAFSQDPKRGHPILVQRYIYRKGGGGGGWRKRSSGKPLKFTLLHISICSKFVRNFSNTLGFVSTEFVPPCFFIYL